MNSFYYKYFKRLLDICLAILAFVIFSPFFILLMLILSISIRGNPFFIQERPGKGGKIFKLIKFKTLNDEKDDQGELLPDIQRLSRIGRFIRSASLDEIPQLLNVIKGDMSLIGPRPLLVEYLPLYNAFQQRRHEVKPGITGWAQVNGRNAISWDQKFEYDAWYIDHCTFLLDFIILLKTVRKVIKREGVNQRGQATMKAFKGNQ